MKKNKNNYKSKNKTSKQKIKEPQDDMEQNNISLEEEINTDIPKNQKKRNKNPQVF